MTHLLEHLQDRQQRGWIFAGTGTLALIAGYVNVVMLGFFDTPVSHMSGAVSRLGIDLATAQLADLWVMMGIVAGFLSGALLSGLWLGAATLQMGRRYGALLLLQGIMLALACWLALAGMQWAVPLAAMACGLQNAMASAYRGLVLRTTHVTGIVTDIGVLIGLRWRHKQIQPWKLTLLMTILGSFFLGGLAGALALARWGLLALAFASAACLLLAAAHYLLVRQTGQ